MLQDYALKRTSIMLKHTTLQRTDKPHGMVRVMRMIRWTKWESTRLKSRVKQARDCGQVLKDSSVPLMEND